MKPTVSECFDLLRACFHGDIGAMRAAQANGVPLSINASCWVRFTTADKGVVITRSAPGSLTGEGYPTSPLIQAAFGNQPTALAWLLDSEEMAPEEIQIALEAALEADAVQAARLLVERGACLLDVDWELLPAATAIDPSISTRAWDRWTWSNTRYSLLSSSDLNASQGHFAVAVEEARQRQAQDTETPQ